MVLTFAPVYADGAYAVKGIANGDRFVISGSEGSTCSVYVVNADATGLAPTAPTGLSSADYYVDGELIGSVSAEPYFCEVPVEEGEHTLKVVANPEEGEPFDIGTYSYTATVMANTNESVIETFDNGEEGAEVVFGSRKELASTESCTYRTAPVTGSKAMTFSYDGEHQSGTSVIYLKNIPVPESKILTLDYDFYSENSNGNAISHHLRNSKGNVVVPGASFGYLTSGKYMKDVWHHISYIFDFNSLTFRGYLDGYEIERGTLNDSENAYIRLYLNRYSVGTLYIDNFKFCGKEEPANIADINYEVKGIKNGDRFPVSAIDTTTQRVYVVDEGFKGLAPEAASAVSSVDFYIDDVLKGSANVGPYYYDVPLESGEHTLKVVAKKVDGSEKEVGTYAYTATVMADSTDSVIEDFDAGVEGADVTFGNPSLAEGETCTYQKAPGTNSMAMAFASTAETGASNFETHTVAVPEESNIITLDYDFYSANSSGNTISHHFRDEQSSAVVPGYTFGTLKASTYDKDTWHHVSTIFDFINGEYRCYLDGFEIERGAVNLTAKYNAFVRLYINRYSKAVDYIDNFKLCGKVDVGSMTETLYTVKGISNGERIPVSMESLKASRTISVVDAAATARTVTAATNLAKADFYIDGNLAGTVSSQPCRWTLPITDSKDHNLSVKTTDFAGNEQIFGPYQYTAVLMEDDESSFKEYFEGTEGEEITKENLSTGDRINTFTSTENPVFAKGPGREDTAMKLTLESGKNTNIKTACDIFVPESGIVTYDFDFYSTTGSEYYKLYLYTRDAGGRNMKDGDAIILENFQMKEVNKNAWHHISYVFDTDRMEYAAFIDGYEFERGAIEAGTPGREVYFQLQTQSWATGEFYIDNIELLSKYENYEDFADITDEGSEAKVSVISSDETKSFIIYRAEYDEAGYFIKATVERIEVPANSFWQGDVSLVPEYGAKTGVFIWDNTSLEPLTDVLKK